MSSVTDRADEHTTNLRRIASKIKDGCDAFDLNEAALALRSLRDERDLAEGERDVFVEPDSKGQALLDAQQEES